MTTTVTVAAFDVDGTLTTSDCVVPFVRRVAGTRSLAVDCLRSPISLLKAVFRRDRDAVKAIGARAAFAGRSVDQVQQYAVEFADEVAAHRLRADTLESLRQHQAADDIVVLVSASFEVYLQPLAAQLGIDHVLAARLAVSDDRYTGDLLGPNCRGPEKVVRLHDWLDQHHGGRASAHITAYGDSAGDLDLLADADEAHWVGDFRPTGWSHE